MAFSIIYSVVDAKNETSNTEVNLPGSVAFADVVIFASQMALLINPLITGAITRIGVVFSVTLPGGLRAAATSGSDVEEGARFQFRTLNGFFTAMRLPTFNEANISSSSRAVDLDDTDVAAYRAAMVSGINLTAAGGSGTISPTDKREEDIVALASAQEQFLSSRS